MLTPRVALLAACLFFHVAPAALRAAEVSNPATSAACPRLAGSSIRWLVPSRPGGGFDAYSRLLQPFLEQKLQATLRLENRPEAAGRMAARLLSEANPDGRTLGMLNGIGLLTARLLEPGTTPDPLNDFTLLGRISHNHMLLLVAQNSGISNPQSLLELAARRPLVAASADVGGSTFLVQPVVGKLLDIPIELVAGYSGTPARVLALMRGEVDIILANHDSVSAQLQGGDLVAILELNDARATGPKLPGLAGADGYAAQRAAAAGRNRQTAMGHAEALARVAQAGRLLAAPGGLPAELQQCLGLALIQAMHMPEFQAAAQRAQLTVAVASAGQAQDETLEAWQALLSLQDLLLNKDG